MQGKHGHKLYSLCSCENIHTPPTEGFFGFESPSLGNSSLASYFASKILAFKTPSP